MRQHKNYEVVHRSLRHNNPNNILDCALSSALFPNVVMCFSQRLEERTFQVSLYIFFTEHIF